MVVALFAQSLFMKSDHSVTGIFKSILSAVIGGTIGGLLYGWMMNKFSTSKMLANSTKIETDPGETIIYEGLANHFKGIEGVGGKLYLTDKRLVFKSHNLNIQNHELSIMLRDIQKAETYKPLHLSSNGLCVETVDGVVEKFVVENAEKWNGLVQERMGSNIM